MHACIVYLFTRRGLDPGPAVASLVVQHKRETETETEKETETQRQREGDRDRAVAVLYLLGSLSCLSIYYCFGSMDATVYRQLLSACAGVSLSCALYVSS